MLNRWNNEGKKIIFFICLLLTVMLSVTSVTYAYFALSAKNENTIVGTAANTGLDLVVERKLPSNVGVMVPQLEEYLGNAISDSHNCIDGNNNTVCQVYKATVTNTSTASIKVNGSIKFSGIENMPNLKWKRIKNETIIGSYTSYNATTTNTYFKRNELFSPSETKEYYFVVWIDETGEAQTDSGTFRTTIEFNPATDEGLTSTIIPISYMTGFSSKDDLSYYRSDTYREKIKNVYFVDYINTTGSVESWDMSDLNMNNAGSVMAWVNTNTTDNNYYDLYIGSNQLIGLIDCSWLFRDMTSVESINFDNFDTRVTTNMLHMFYNCVNLINLDVSGFDTSNVISMRAMFASNPNIGVMSLKSLDVSGFDTSNVIDMKGMFQNCGELTNLDVSGFDTSKVTNMETMFYNCEKLTSLDVSGFDTSSVTNMGGMFQNCGELTNLDVSDWDTGQVTIMTSMFYGCKNFTNLDVSKWDTSQVTDMYTMFYNCEKLINLDVSGFDTSNVTTMQSMFTNCVELISLDVSGWDTSNVTTMQAMFANCVGLIRLDVSNWDVSSVTNMRSMFMGSYNSSAGSILKMNLANLDVSKWDTSQVNNMYGMFQNCINLTNLDVSNWNTLNVTDMSYMFKGCVGLTSLNVSSWNTSNVTNMYAMFAGNFSDDLNVNEVMNLTTLDVSKWDTSKVTSMSYMFQNCNKLSTNITIKNTGTTSYEYMFFETATESGTSITVNYTSATSSLVDSMIATKSSNSNVAKGSLVS